MPSESRLEQIMAALASSMAGITGGAYHYPNPTVARVPWFEDAMLDDSLDVVYLLRPGDEDHSEQGSSGILQADAEVFALLAKRFEPSSEDPFTGPTPLRVTVANRLVRDFLLRLWNDVQLGGALGVDNMVNGSLVVDRARILPKWALVELRFVIRYTYGKATP